MEHSPKQNTFWDIKHTLTNLKKQTSYKLCSLRPQRHLSRYKQHNNKKEIEINSSKRKELVNPSTCGDSTTHFEIIHKIKEVSRKIKFILK